ncbi:hypothetical protein [Brachybacterium sp. p3-SID957]|uniref:hypothetical protein n=1 Tax=Brachybacterium sp. p3-SID957 TaxID=2916049 RepID=UPI00223A8D9A|nr:hypothetical protein [Brachybacterium sp. p3-SID957]MCT1775135.1 hypothetical protein [Brachybacterium sp. p3-SID957]
MTTELRYFTDAVGDHAVDFLRRHAEASAEQAGTVIRWPGNRSDPPRPRCAP